MMDAKTLFDTVTSSPAFMSWMTSHPGAYVCSFFKIVDAGKEGGYQIDFYYPSGDSMSSFVMNGGQAALSQVDAQIFKQDKDKVKKLSLDDVHVTEKQVQEIVNEIHRTKYKRIRLTKYIFILQHLSQPLWNVSAIADNFHILHVKVDAATGEILEESLKNPLSFRKE
jgi:uncharacterized protein YpmB